MSEQDPEQFERKMATFVQVPVFYCIFILSLGKVSNRWVHQTFSGILLCMVEEEALFTRRLAHFELHFTGNHYNPVVLESDDLPILFLFFSSIIPAYNFQYLLFYIMNDIKMN